MRKIFQITAILIFIFGVLTANAHAGRSCEEKKLSPQTLERGLLLAENTLKVLETGEHKVVVLARAGQDLTKYGVHYSHVGFAYRQPDGRGGHVWRVLHKLNHCGTDVAAIYRQGLGEFFLDDLWRHEAVFAVPSPEAQERLLALLLDERQSLRMHHKPYSIVSYAWGRKYQQSNQWAMETMAAAMEPAVRSRAQAQAWLQLRGYEPATLRLDALTRLGGRISAANVAFDDHPAAKRFSDRIETVTADSVLKWLESSELGGPLVHIGLRQKGR